MFTGMPSHSCPCNSTSEMLSVTETVCQKSLAVACNIISKQHLPLTIQPNQDIKCHYILTKCYKK